MKSKKSKSNKTSIENLKMSLETQTRVAEVLEQERDRAFDDYEMAQVRPQYSQVSYHPHLVLYLYIYKVILG